MRFPAIIVLLTYVPLIYGAPPVKESADVEFYEKRIRPILVRHCYECHSEAAKEQQGGLLLDRQTGWFKGGETENAVVAGDVDGSLLIKAVRYQDERFQMPPTGKLDSTSIGLLEEWIRRGALGSRNDLGNTAFSRLGDQEYLFEKAKSHWSFQAPKTREPPLSDNPTWNRTAIDRWVAKRLGEAGISFSKRADARTITRRLSYDLTGLPPTSAFVSEWAAKLYDPATRKWDERSYTQLVDEFISGPAFGEHFARMWLDVARYADTDSFYRPDTRTPHYFPFAFTYRDYVIDAFNGDKPFDQFIKEQLAADLLGFNDGSKEIAALGFLAVGPHANRNPVEALDDWIDVTTRGLMGLTVSCSRCHDHKYEPIPTADYYSLRGIFASVVRPSGLKEELLPKVPGYAKASAADLKDYQRKRAAIDKKIKQAEGKKSRNNNRSIAQKIRETELAELLLFHPGGPVHAMVVRDRPRPVGQFVFLRGDPRNRGPNVARRFLTLLDPEQTPFANDQSGRLELAEKIVSSTNPLTARVFVNRVWGQLTGRYLVDTPSDFGLQGARPTNQRLLDWLALDFVREGWSVKRLVAGIVSSETYRQNSDARASLPDTDPQNQLQWRAIRKHKRIEVIRDSMLRVSEQLDDRLHGRASRLWGAKPTRRRAIYGYVNRFNLDPTLRAFDFPSPMATQAKRGESIVATQALFALNSPFVIACAEQLTRSDEFIAAKSDGARGDALFQSVFQRLAEPEERTAVLRFVKQQRKSAGGTASDASWSLVAQSLLMSNEFQYVD